MSYMPVCAVPLTKKINLKTVNKKTLHALIKKPIYLLTKQRGGET
jgi:hypothetical protein